MKSSSRSRISHRSKASNNGARRLKEREHERARRRATRAAIRNRRLTSNSTNYWSQWRTANPNPSSQAASIIRGEGASLSLPLLIMIIKILQSNQIPNKIPAPTTQQMTERQSGTTTIPCKKVNGRIGPMRRTSQGLRTSNPLRMRPPTWRKLRPRDRTKMKSRMMMIYEMTKGRP